MKIDPPIELFDSHVNQLEVAKYYNGTTAVQLLCDNGEPFSTVSANLPESTQLAEGEFFLRDYSEHAVLAKALLDRGIIELVTEKGRTRTGYVSVPVARLTKSFLEANREEHIQIPPDPV